MSPSVRKLALATHLAFSLGWVGAVVAYLALGLSAVNTEDPESIRAAWVGMEVTGWYAVVPLAVGSLLTGTVMALGSRWGLFRHYWVLFSFALTALSTFVLLVHMPDVSAQARVARDAEGATLESLGGDLLHPALGLGVLLTILVLNVYKPSGLTRYGWRKQNEQRRGRAVGSLTE